LATVYSRRATVTYIHTAEERSVLESSIYSKSVLRVAAAEVSHGHDHIAYFPSYEIITGNHAGNQYYEPDLREVRQAGVSHVMRLFMKHYADVDATTPARTTRTKKTPETIDLVEKAAAVMCDETALAR
jgi:hypothetical protein